MAAAVLCAFLVLLVGLVMLILELGYRVTDKDPRRKTVDRMDAVETSRFFGRKPLLNRKVHAETDEAVFWRVKEYLETEQTLAAKFVSKPSVEALYRDSRKKESQSLEEYGDLSDR